MRLVAIAVSLAASVVSLAAREAVYLDKSGVIRWSDDDREVALFGANYCLPSASDYRAAGRVGADRRRLIERDMAHFARMGWDGLRVALWGDWENSDRAGNLVVNEHLDLMDYLIHQAKQRGISILFTPMHTHSALWPDGGDDPSVQGFSRHFPRDRMGCDPAAIAAQANFLRQILDHVNPYTGVALKDEPAIVFIELINEPWHHPEDPAGAVAYINALVDAVRSTGCEKILFHNLSQDFAMAGVIRASRAQGVSFGWYPTGLLAGRTLKDSFLRWVDEYPPMRDAAIATMPRIVYEFDAADTLSPAMYPAMVRTFRGVGAQFAAMFAYDMLDTAPYNLGWQTHFLNLVHTPCKSMGAVIAAEAMRRLPRGEHYGPYPENLGFGPFGISSDSGGAAWMVAPDAFLYAGDCRDVPVQTGGLRRIAGVGRSAVVEYEGTGAYFLDRVAAGVWRLELFPDAVLVRDPFAGPEWHDEIASRLVWRTWPMRIRIPELGDAFMLEPLNAGNTHRGRAIGQQVDVRPGVYLVTRSAEARPASLPARIGQLGFAEFVCPEPSDVAPQIQPHVREEYASRVGGGLTWDLDVVSREVPARVELQIRGAAEERWRVLPMQRVAGFRYRATVEAGVGPIAWRVEADADGVRIRFPSGRDNQAITRVVAADSPLVVFAPARDGERLYLERRESRRGAWPLEVRRDPDATVPALRFSGVDAPMRVGWSVRDAIAARGDQTGMRDAVRIRASATKAGRRVTLVLIEIDGTSWSASIALGNGVGEHVIPLDALALGGGSKLPVGYPGSWNTALPPAAGRGGAGDRVRLAEVQQMQLVFEPVENGGAVDIEAVALTAEKPQAR